jgi:ABC-type bacteriocin/lantibiotic exporter with double-glycine peptidase domain
MGITRIIVAHRSETISAADRLFVAANGKLEEVSGRDADAVGSAPQI